MSAQLASKYGRKSGQGYKGSVNGTQALIETIESYGYSVGVRSSISPKISRYETIFWFPDSFNGPSPRVEQRLTEWLEGKSNRTLVYVGRDYDAATEYWYDLAQSSSGNQRAIALRQWSLHRSEHLGKRQRKELKGCSWFSLENGSEGTTASLTGKLVAADTTVQPTVRTGGIRLVPPTAAPPKLVNTMLSADGQPFIFEIVWPNRSRVVVVNNGSGLLNYPYRTSSQSITPEIVMECLPDFGDVLFLESGERDPPIVSGDGPPTMWAWMREKPLNYILPHFIVLGIIACFAFFPILGRPRRGVRKATTSFRRHISAIGGLLKNSSDFEQAKQSIEYYKKHIKRETG
ncbi:MAG: hypothetical protein ABL888_07795 [Pirellulaceae bacterium]